MSFVGTQTIGKIMHDSFWKRTGSYQPLQYQFLSSTLLRLSTLKNSTNETCSDTRSHVLSREWICSWSRGTFSTTSGWSIIVFPTKAQLILEVWRYYTLYLHSNTNGTTWILSTETPSILPLLVCCMVSTVTIWRPLVVSLYKMAIVHQVLLTNPTSNYIFQKNTCMVVCSCNCYQETQGKHIHAVTWKTFKLWYIFTTAFHPNLSNCKLPFWYTTGMDKVWY